MRILHLSTARTWRGGEQQVAYLMQELQRRQVDQLVVCAGSSPMAQRCAEQGIAHECLPFRLAFDPLNAWRLSRKARAWQADLVHVHDSHGHTAAVLANQFFGMGLPLVVSRRVDFAISSGFSSRWKYGHPSVKRILCVSQAIREIMAERLVRPQVLRVVYDGIDPARFAKGPDGRLRRELGIGAEVPLIGNVAALAPHKDLFTFIRMAARIRQHLPAARFVLIGEGALQGELQRYAADRGMGTALTFTGFRTDVDRLLPELDAMAMTSKTEGLGTSILDAFAARVPVVATAAGGIPEVVEQGRSGLLCPVGDDAALAAAVVQVLGNGDLRNHLVEGAGRKLQAFSREAMAAATLQEYQEVLGGEAGAANTKSV